MSRSATAPPGRSRPTGAATICSSRRSIAGVTTNMTVVTSARIYYFELAPLSGGEMAYTVRFRYPNAQAAADEAPAPISRAAIA